MQRLGKNTGAYFGEGIDIARVVSDSVAAAKENGWTVEQINPAPREMVAFVRSSNSGSGQKQRIYISTGIHGDEPAGPLAIRQLLQENKWPSNIDLWICPCLNPSGFPLNRRENAEGLDLNREYHNPTSTEVKAHVEWLKRQPSFEISFCVHEDWESNGFYVYELNPQKLPSMAEAMVAGVAKVCPVDQSEMIEGWPAVGGIIRPEFDPRSRPLWPEAFYLLTNKSRRSYTLEAPSDFAIETRVAGLVAGIRASLDEFLRAA